VLRSSFEGAMAEATAGILTDIWPVSA